MASSESYSPSSPSSELSLTTDEFEGLEVMEFDPSALRELLYGPGEGGESGEEAMEEDGGGNEEERLGVENWWCFDEYKDGIGNLESEWLDVVMEETCNEVAVWSEEVNQEYEFFAFPPSGIVCDDIGYIGLWQDS